jgi:cytochrome oxidase Cu insertion factor (SCO1/SenC/PrrC family)
MQVAKAFRAPFSVDRDGGGDIAVRHSGLVYLIDRKGRVIKLLPPGTGGERYAEELRRILAIQA